MSRVLVVIPARYDSSRFPGKALADLAGRPLVVRVVERAMKMQTADLVMVATDDERIFAAVVKAGFAAEMTSAHPTGSDRVGEVARRHPADIVVNLQGDEPLLAPADADSLVRRLQGNPGLDVATLAHAFAGAKEWRDPNAVKVLVDHSGHALYFSRAPIPAAFPGSAATGEDIARRHIGIYAWRSAALQRFLRLPRGRLEQAEGLEQLRALENGLRIAVMPTEERPLGVDTPEDLAEVRRRWASPV